MMVQIFCVNTVLALVSVCTMILTQLCLVTIAMLVRGGWIMLWYQTIPQISVAYKYKGLFFSHSACPLWTQSSGFVPHPIHSGTLDDGARSIWHIEDYHCKGKENM